MAVGKEQVKVSIIVQIKEAWTPAYIGPGKFMHHRRIKIVYKNSIAQDAVVAALIIDKKCQGIHFRCIIGIDQVGQSILVHITQSNTHTAVGGTEPAGSGKWLESTVPTIQVKTIGICIVGYK